jgi:hypothetical protein
MIIMQTHSSWANWLINHDSNDAGNRILQAFRNILSLGDSNYAKLQALVKEIDTVILATNASGNIMVLHSPKNFGGTRTHPDNKIVCMLGLGPHSICVLLDLKTAFTDLSIVVPSVQDLAGCISAEQVQNIPAPEENGLVGFKGSAIFIPSPVF